MLKKVKAKQYKSKREFKDDLDLIWSNCFMYNATEVSLSMVHSSSSKPHLSPLSALHCRLLRPLGSSPSTMCDALKEQG